MKTAIFAVIFTVAGGLIGFTLTWLELTRVGEVGLGSPVAAIGSSGTASGAASERPLVVVEGGTDFDFGVMERGATLSHTFVFTNKGTAPLTLQQGETSCKCTMSELADGEIGPGESTEVTLEWNAKEYENRFHQTAEIHTNDPARRIVILSVQGRVIQSVRHSPESLALGSVSRNDTTTAELRLFNYADEPLEFADIQWGNQEIADYFSTEIEPLPEEDLKTDQFAKSGKLVKIRIKSGLPLGPINQTIRLTTNMPEVPVLEVPLVLTVTGDISIVGRGFLSESNTLMLGRVRSREGASVRLNLLVKGPHRESIEITLGEVDPGDVLQVRLGEPRPLKDGAIIMIPLEVTVPPGSRSANHISTQQRDQGKIELETNHPDVKQLPIYVRFAIE